MSKTIIWTLTLIFITLTGYIIYNKKNKKTLQEKNKTTDSNDTNTSQQKQKKEKTHLQEQQDIITENSTTEKKDYSPRILDTEELYFFPNYNQSPDESYIFAYRQEPTTEYILLKDDQILLHEKFARLKYGSVANNGIHVINCWGITTNLCAHFYAINNKGRVLLNQNFKADLYNNGISDEGDYAVCQTLDSKYDKYSNKLFFFDLKQQKLLWATEPTPGRANSYTFDVSNKKLTLHYDNQPAYSYDFAGNFIDSEKWRQNNLQGLTPSEIFFKLEARHKDNLEQLSTAQLKRSLKSFKELLDTEITEVKYKHARTFRYIGEIYQQLNQKKKALQHFEQALKISERVGVKRVTKNLKKELD